MKKLILTVAFAMMCAVFANADVISAGPGAVTGSWTQQWIWQNTTVDTVTFVMLSGSSWEHAIHDISDPSWSSTSFDATTISASGNPDVNFTYDTDFVTAMNQSLSYRWFGSVNGTVIDQGVASWDGQSWSYQTETPTPEPASLILLGSGLLGIGGVVRKKFSA